MQSSLLVIQSIIHAQIEKIQIWILTLLTVIPNVFNSIQNPSTLIMHQKTPNQQLVWEKINNWEKSQNFDEYIENSNLCSIADQRLHSSNVILKDYLYAYKYGDQFISLAENSSTGEADESNIVQNWLTQKLSLSNLTTYYKYSCLRCDQLTCIQIFGNIKNDQVIINQKSVQVNKNNDLGWGIAQHVTGPEYTIRLGSDNEMGSAIDIYNALNIYRSVHGKSNLVWSDTLANYAVSRAAYYVKMNKLDAHAGINDYLQNHNGFTQLGFSAIGENGALLGGKLLGVHVIEWVFAGDIEHDSNQLDSQWTHVGIGVSGLGVDVVFGAKKM